MRVGRSGGGEGGVEVDGGCVGWGCVDACMGEWAGTHLTGEEGT